jgi:hypothetical protein
MRKLLLLVLVVSICGLVGCEESTGDKIERKVRNAADDLTK